VHADLQRLLAPDLLPDITTVPLDRLRNLRSEASEAEHDLSFVRRVAQGRLDIIGHETRRRAGAKEHEPPVAGLLFDLPDVLSAGASASPAPGAGSRPVAIHVPGQLAQQLVTELNQVATAAELSRLDQLDDQRLAAVRDGLRELEVKLSTTRRRLHERIDSIQDEVARRYRDGEASVDSLLG
jgi:hypothetical protein